MRPRWSRGHPAACPPDPRKAVEFRHKPLHGRTKGAGWLYCGIVRHRRQLVQAMREGSASPHHRADSRPSVTVSHCRFDVGRIHDAGFRLTASGLQRVRRRAPRKACPLAGRMMRGSFVTRAHDPDILLPCSRENVSRPTASWRRSVAPPRGGLAERTAQAVRSMGRLCCELPQTSTLGGREPIRSHRVISMPRARTHGRHPVRR
jgi:hypothetical protein